MFSKKSSLGYLQALIAGIGWGTIGLWLQYVNGRAIDIAFLRMAGAGVFFSTGKLQFNLKAGILGVILALQFIATISAFQFLPIGTATLSVNLNLIFLTLLLFPTLPRKHIRLVLLGEAFIGLWLAFYDGFQFYGFLVGISASFLFALYTFLAEKFALDMQVQMPVIFLTATVVTGVISFITGFQTIQITLIFVATLLLLIGLSTIAAHYSFLASVKNIGSEQATVIAYSAIPIAFLIDILQGNPATFIQIIGMLILCQTLISLTLLDTFEFPKKKSLLTDFDKRTLVEK